MKDYRVPIALGIPAAMALFGLLWVLRRKSGSGEKKTSKALPKKKESSSERNENAKVERGQNQQIEKEGITITQRKIPEVQARDRGSSDLIGRPAPDFTAGVKKSSENKASAEGKNKAGQAGNVDGLTSPQREQLENIVTTALGDGLHEAQSKLAKKPAIPSTPKESTDRPKSASSSERAEGFKVVQEVLLKQDAGFKSEPSPSKPESLEVGADLQVPDSAALYTSTPIPGMPLENKPAKCDTSVKANHSHSAPAASIRMSILQQSEHQEQAEATLSSSSSSKPLSTESPQKGGSDLKTLSSRHNQNQVKSQVSDLKISADDKGHSEQQASTQKAATANSAQTSEQMIARATSGSQRLPQEHKGASSSTSPQNRVSHTSISSVDSLGSTEDVESIWGIKSDKDSLLDSAVAFVDSEASVSFLDKSSSSAQGSSADSQSQNESGIGNLSAMSGASNSSLTVPESQGVNDASTTREDGKGDSPTKSSSPVCDNNSEGSNDSGRGGSEHDVAGQGAESLVHFDFNMPSDLCGRFIGKQGKNINYLKSKTGAHVSLTNNPFTAEYQICQIVGTQSEVDDAIAMIRRKFPFQEYQALTMVPINVPPAPVQVDHPVIVPDVMQLSLPEGVSVEVYVSAIVDANHIFVQQPTHRSFMSLEKLTYFLNTVYGQDANVPCVPTPVECGVICVCENEGCWYRAMIMAPEDESGNVQIKFVDYGGYELMPVTALKQIRTDFMSLPFQAVECFMANITPNQGDLTFSEEATMSLKEMTEAELLQCQVVARTENGIPYIHLYKINPESNSAVMINKALVNNRRARWIEIL